jgi:hypothetical protein
VVSALRPGLRTGTCSAIPNASRMPSSVTRRFYQMPASGARSAAGWVSKMSGRPPLAET